MIQQTHHAARRRVAMLMLVGSFAMAACTSGSSADTPTAIESTAPSSDPSDPVESSAPSSAPNPTTPATTPDSTVTPATSIPPVSVDTIATPTTAGATGPAPDDLDVVEAGWIALWDAVRLADGDKLPAITALGGLLDSDVVDPVAGIFDGSVTRTITNHPTFTPNEDGSVSVNDCLYVEPTPTLSISTWYEGRAVRGVDGGWTFVAVSERSSTGCVPESIASEAIADYEEFWTARNEYWNPADPAHPGVNKTMTGDHRERIVGLLLQHQRDGWYVENDDRVIHPEILRIGGLDQVVILDCQLADQNRGLFNASGERQAGIDPAQPDQRDIYEVTMLLEEGQWKTSDIQLQENVACEFAPTPQGIPVV